MKREYTATAYIFHEDKTLLLQHPKIGMWLPPGGHLEPGEMPHEGARREVFEETGLDIEFLLQENLTIDRWNAKSIPRPYLCLCEKIPSPPHEHIDFIYISQPIGIKPVKSDFPIKWFTLEAIEALKSDQEIFEETKETLRHLFKSFLTLSI